MCSKSLCVCSQKYTKLVPISRISDYSLSILGYGISSSMKEGYMTKKVYLSFLEYLKHSELVVSIWIVSLMVRHYWVQACIIHFQKQEASYFEGSKYYLDGERKINGT